jgi:hypothetical protein
MKHLKQDKEWQRNLIRHLWCKRRNTPINFTDLTFVCADGTIAAHRAYLSVNCSLMDNLFKVQDDNDVTIIVPEVRVETVQKFLEILYTGSAVFATDEGLEELDNFGSLILGFSVAMFWNTTISIPEDVDDHEVYEVNQLTTEVTRLEEPEHEDVADVEIGSREESEELSNEVEDTNGNLPETTNMVIGEQFGCRYCSEIFSSPIALAYHVKTVHNFNLMGQDATLAKTSTPLQHKMKPSHAKTMDQSNHVSVENLESNKDDFCCSYCSMTFLSVIKLAFHVKTNHKHLLTSNSQQEGRKRQLEPDHKLDDVTLNKRAKKMNYNEATNGTVVYPCQYCQKTFPLLSILKLHQKNFHAEKTNEVFKRFRAQRSNKKRPFVQDNPDFKSRDNEEKQNLDSNQEASVVKKKETRGRKPMPIGKIKQKTKRGMKKAKDLKKVDSEKLRENDHGTETGLLPVAFVALVKLSFCKFCKNYFETREQLKAHITSNHELRQPLRFRRKIQF